MKIVRVPALTGLRFVAAMMVLIGHGLYTAHFAADTMTSRILDPLPSTGMTLFFVFSGFVMWVSYAQSFRERFRSSLWALSSRALLVAGCETHLRAPNARAG
jgi:peptidoglycan/LPS O-acetylase OafA/YrhL